jgi:hypothetical protein
MGPGPTIGTSGFRGAHSRPFNHGGNSPFIPGGGPFISRGGFAHGGFAHGGNFVRGGAFVRVQGFVGPVHFFRPYYTFHPHVIVGFGLWAGYPFAYPYAFYYPYYSYYPYYPYAYGSLSAGADATTSYGSVVQPNQTNMGGMSFDITPSNAELFVDNMRVGTVGEFTPTTQPLGLEAGHHHVEIRAAGYQTMSLDVDIIAGQVIPYQGTMER